MNIIVVQVVGFANSGKTTLIGQIIDSLNSKYRIGVIKSAKNHKKLDDEKDSYQHLKKNVCVSTAIFSDIVELSVKKSQPLSEIINIHNDIFNCDLVILEGFKKENYPKILTWSKEVEENLNEFNLDNLLSCYLVNPKQNKELDKQYKEFLKNTHLPSSSDFEDLMTRITTRIKIG